MSVRVVVCEGYHDRSFWAAWLARLGCTDIRMSSDLAVAVVKRFAVKGTFGYLTPSGVGLLLTCPDRNRYPGRDGMKQAVGNLLATPLGGIDHLLVSVDSDADGEAAGSALCEADVRQWADLSAIPRVDVTLWQADDPPTPGIPTKQTLERLVCASVAAAYPACAADVQAWLDGRHPGPGDPAAHSGAMQAKSAAFSYQAGWFPNRIGDDFYRAVWDDLAIASELEARLATSGALAVAQALTA